MRCKQQDEPLFDVSLHFNSFSAARSNVKSTPKTKEFGLVFSLSQLKSFSSSQTSSSGMLYLT